MTVELEKDCDMCTLEECPPGLFLFDGILGFKTEYSMELGRLECYPQAFVVASGEVFWGGARSHEERSKLMVQPLLCHEDNLKTNC